MWQMIICASSTLPACEAGTRITMLDMFASFPAVAGR